MARCARSPELRGDSDRLGVARVRTRATTPGLSPPCWFRARAIDEQRSVARPSGCWWLAACDIHMLPLTSKIKGETRTPIFYHSLKLEITFCVQGVSTLLFENEYGEKQPITVETLLTEIRRQAPDRLPRFFFLACCHSGDAPVSDRAAARLPAVATALHRDGITQVVGYFGPVLDEASTRAERAFYAELANGRRTRDAVRAARLALSQPLPGTGREV